MTLAAITQGPGNLFLDRLRILRLGAVAAGHQQRDFPFDVTAPIQLLDQIRQGTAHKLFETFGDFTADDGETLAEGLVDLPGKTGDAMGRLIPDEGPPLFRQG